MGLGKMMDFTLMFIVTITLVLLNFSPSAYSDTYVDLTAILSAPGSPFHSFLSLIQTENVIQILEQQGNSEPGLTLFVPNDDAIARDNVPWGTLSLAGVQALLLFHAIPQYISATAISLSALSKISPVLTMAGVQSNTLSGFNLDFTYASVSDTLYLNSGWTQTEVLGTTTKNITFFPTEIYQIDKVLMPEAIFGTNIPPPPSTSASEAIFGANIPPPPSTSASSAPSASTTSTPHKNKSGNSPPTKSRTGLSGGVIAGISTGGVVGALLVAACIKCGFYFYRISSSKRDVDPHLETRIAPGSTSEESDSTGTPVTPSHDLIISVYKAVEFSYEELAKATNGFSIDLKIGQGAFGAVYCAELRGEKAAIKKMDMTAKTEFRAELDVLTHAHHLNVVHLIGYGVDRFLFLVYEYIENGNLSQHLHDTERDPLPWPTRVQIALDSARGLEYIHEYTTSVYIHRDIKSANILIDKSFRAKIADFGLTKLAELGGSTNLSGTSGYIAPECRSLQCRDISPKVDVYAFGVVLYELISAKQAITAEPKGLDSLFEEALNKPDDRREDLCKLIDPRLGDNYPLESVLEMARLAQACTRVNQEHRPSMRVVVRELLTL